MRFSEIYGASDAAQATTSDPFSDMAMSRRSQLIWRTGAIRDVRAGVDRDAWRKAMRAIKRARSSGEPGRSTPDVLVLTGSDVAASPQTEDILVLNRLAR